MPNRTRTEPLTRTEPSIESIIREAPPTRYSFTPSNRITPTVDEVVDAFISLENATVPRRPQRRNARRGVDLHLNEAMQYAIEGARVPTIPEGLELVNVSYGSDDYQIAASRAWRFFRTSRSRYSDKTLMNVARIEDDIQEGLTDNLPFFITATMPYSYDEDTETKYGGLVGMRISWPDKTIISVSPSARRNGIGTLLLSPFFPNPNVLWAGGSNSAAQLFLISRGFSVYGMNRAGSIAFARQVDEEVL